MTREQLEELYAKLKLKSGLCLERNNRLFVVGGSKDLLIPLCQSYSEKASAEQNSVVIILSNRIVGATQDVAYKQLFESTQLQNVKTIFFGVNQSQIN